MIIARQRIRDSVGTSSRDVEVMRVLRNTPPYLPVPGMTLMELADEYRMCGEAEIVWESGPIDHVNLVRAAEDAWVVECWIEDDTRRQDWREGERPSVDELLQDYLDAGWELADEY